MFVLKNNNCCRCSGEVWWWFQETRTVRFSTLFPDDELRNRSAAATPSSPNWNCQMLRMMGVALHQHLDAHKVPILTVDIPCWALLPGYARGQQHNVRIPWEVAVLVHCSKTNKYSDAIVCIFKEPQNSLLLIRRELAFVQVCDPSSAATNTCPSLFLVLGGKYQHHRKTENSLR